MPINSVLLDTSFLIRLLKGNDFLHGSEKDYFRYFLKEDVILKCSTIAIAEYCVKGRHDQLPLRNLQILPFNFNHAVRSGQLMAMLKESKGTPIGIERAVVINDIKLFAQADIESDIAGFITSDSEGRKLYDALKNISGLSFEYIDIKMPCNDRYGYLSLS
jgi:predicted nucleic acid-binding protein